MPLKYPEAFTWSAPELVSALQDMGVEQTLISHAESDVRLLGGLYIYVLVEAENA